MRKAAILNWATYSMVARLRRSAAKPRWRIGIYKNDRLGDFVLGLGAIRTIVNQAGAKQCVLFHSKIAAPLAAQEFPDVDRVELPDADSRLWITHRRMRENRRKVLVHAGVEQLLCLRHFRTLADELMLQMITANAVWCVENSGLFSLDYEIIRRRFEGDVTIRRPAPGEERGACEDLRCHERLLRFWGGRKAEPPDLRPAMRRAARPRPVLVVAPFGSSSIRDLPPAVIAACVQRAREAHGLDIAVPVPPGEAERYAVLARRLAELGAPVQLQASARVEDLVALLASSSAVLTTETATAHLAVALDRPMVCVIGGGHFGLFAPWTRSLRQVWLTHDLPCFGCGWSCTFEAPYCIEKVEPATVANALDRVLAAAVLFS